MARSWHIHHSHGRYVHCYKAMLVKKWHTDMSALCLSNAQYYICCIVVFTFCARVKIKYNLISWVYANNIIFRVTELHSHTMRWYINCMHNWRGGKDKNYVAYLVSFGWVCFVWEDKWCDTKHCLFWEWNNTLNRVSMKGMTDEGLGHGLCGLHLVK